jgi:hypothetical protein
VYATSTVMSTSATTVSVALPAGAGSPQEPREERVELGDAVLRNIDCDLRVLRVASEIGLH